LLGAIDFDVDHGSGFYFEIFFSWLENVNLYGIDCEAIGSYDSCGVCALVIWNRLVFAEAILTFPEVKMTAQCRAASLCRPKWIGAQTGKHSRNVGMANNSKYDETLMAMLQQHSSDMEFMNTMFGFMQRRTSCFNGPKVHTYDSSQDF
jgi:hypothetical protein